MGVFSIQGRINERISTIRTTSKKYYDFENLAAIVSWDEAAMMPTGGGQARAEALATLSTVQHGWLTNKK